MSTRMPATGSTKPAVTGFLLAGLFMLYLACGSTGYGNDGDTYAMLGTWSGLVRGEGYMPSRAPGFPVPELILGAAAELGGSRVANAVTAMTACAALAAFYFLLLPLFGSACALLSMAAVGLNPVWVVAASSSMDYCFGAAFFLWGLVALRRYGPLGSAPLFALAVASRITYAPLALIALAVQGCLSSRGGRAANGASAGLFLGLAALAYAPAWDAIGPGLFQATVGDRHVAFLGWEGLSGFVAYAGRFVFKNISLWGIPAFALLLAAAAAAVRGRMRGREIGLDRRVVWGVVIGLVCSELIFLRLPMEIAYLLPVLPAVIFLINMAPGARYWLMALTLSQFLQGWISLEPLEIEYASHSHARVEASGARFHPHWEKGVILKDWLGRPAAQEYFFETVLKDNPPASGAWKP